MKTDKNKARIFKTPRTLKGFLDGEDGYVSKEAILNVGLATIGVLGVMGSFSDPAYAGHTNHGSHSNGAGTFHTNASAGHVNTAVAHSNLPHYDDVPSGGCRELLPEHNSIAAAHCNVGATHSNIPGTHGNTSGHSNHSSY